MKIKELREKVSNSGLFGLTKTIIDEDRDVIVQVYKGEHDFGDGGSTMPIYEYHEIRAVGTLFHHGEFKMVIAVGEEAP